MRHLSLDDVRRSPGLRSCGSRSAPEARWRCGWARADCAARAPASPETRPCGGRRPAGCPRLAASALSWSRIWYCRRPARMAACTALTSVRRDVGRSRIVTLRAGRADLRSGRLPSVRSGGSSARPTMAAAGPAPLRGGRGACILAIASVSMIAPIPGVDRLGECAGICAALQQTIPARRTALHVASPSRRVGGRMRTL